MQIVCPHCTTAYDVKPSSLGERGRQVRCTRCRESWFAEPKPAPALETVANAAPDMAAPPAEPQPPMPPTEPEAAMAAPLPEEPPAPEAWAESSAEPAILAAADAPPTAPEAAPQFIPPDPEPQPETPVGPPQAAISEFMPEPVAPVAAPPLAPSAENAEAAAPAARTIEPAGEDIETFAARRMQRDALRRRGSLPLPSLPATIVVMLATITALIGWRHDVVRFAPQTASFFGAIGMPVNLRGLQFENVTTIKDLHDGVNVLLVEGTIVGAGLRSADVPRLRFSVRDARGLEIYSWTALPAQSVLAPGERLAFRSRLASPPTEAREVLVRFFNRRDILTGVR